MVFGAVLRQEMAFFDQSRTGELITRLSADTSLVGQALTSNISDGLRSLAQISVGLCMMVQYCCPIQMCSDIVILALIVFSVLSFS